jgi:hypothetical protein
LGAAARGAFELALPRTRIAGLRAASFFASFCFRFAGPAGLRDDRFAAPAFRAFGRWPALSLRLAFLAGLEGFLAMVFLQIGVRGAASTPTDPEMGAINENFKV